MLRRIEPDARPLADPRKSAVAARRGGPLARSLAIAVMACAGLIGCGGGETVSISAPSTEEARRAITEALDAWKEGTTAELERREPPLRFYDSDRDQGVKLLDFAIKEPATEAGSVVEVPVTLTFQKGRSGRRSHDAVYQVTLQPDVVVLRSDP